MIKYEKIIHFKDSSKDLAKKPEHIDIKYTKSANEEEQMEIRTLDSFDEILETDTNTIKLNERLVSQKEAESSLNIIWTRFQQNNRLNEENSAILLKIKAILDDIE